MRSSQKAAQPEEPIFAMGRRIYYELLHHGPNAGWSQLDTSHEFRA
jgi:hypothetical protein